MINHQGHDKELPLNVALMANHTNPPGSLHVDITACYS